MALSPRLDLRQSQSLVITPQLQQAIKLLQLSATELQAYVEQELQSNPLLEIDESGEASALSEGAGNSSDRENPDTSIIDTMDGQDEAPLDLDSVGVDDDVLIGPDKSSDFDSLPTKSASAVEDSLPTLEQTLADTPDLRSHLIQQLNLAVNAPVDRFIGMYLIDQLDESGYLQIGVEEAASQLGADTSEVARILGLLQGFDPSGIFARNLKECLELQLIDRNRLDPAMSAFIENIELLAKHDLGKLREACGVSVDDLKDMISEVRALDPKPALRFERVINESVIPDVLMSTRADGSWRVELNPETLPRVLVNQNYMANINPSAATKEDKAFMAERLQSANWLVKALHQRAETILKVAIELVKQQDMFFRRGITYLKPLILRTVADAIEMHESTVSRVTTNKYIATPRGIFELKYFFTQSLPSSSGKDAHSAEAVRYRIKALIDAEAATDVLSDDRIVEILSRDGIEVARRTVAKYRDSLNIASSVQRRRAKTTGLRGF
ncbi:MAG TPA: RNA polymerase sigma-54 factor [Rhodospirillaceae bacterium]|nr:RNA polymerase sigma-54 factor [Candidatus Neomarinimicrobiota bacterium]HCX13699.1 RNA polymerase sigma-54 factor [Rhodospirillaceae bacterium]